MSSINKMSKATFVTREKFLDACRTSGRFVTLYTEGDQAITELRRLDGQLIGLGDYKHKKFVLDPDERNGSFFS